MSRLDEGRIFPVQGALEQLSQHFGANSSEARGLLLCAIGLLVIFLYKRTEFPHSLTPRKRVKITLPSF
jgi:hypothetical protein